MTKLLSIAAIVTLLIISALGIKFLMRTDSGSGDATAATATGSISSVHQALTQKREAPLSENELADLETTLNAIIKNTEKNDADTHLKAQTYLIDVYSRRAGAAPLIPDKEAWSKKSEQLFFEVIKAKPDYPLPYAIHAVSLSVAPAFLGTHGQAQIYFEKALSLIPDARADRNTDDWDALAITVRFYPALLQKRIDQNKDAKANAQRIKEVELLLKR